MSQTKVEALTALACFAKGGKGVICCKPSEHS